MYLSASLCLSYHIGIVYRCGTWNMAFLTVYCYLYLTPSFQWRAEAPTYLKQAVHMVVIEQINRKQT